MEAPHRKVELQSPSDLTYLQTRIRTLALQKLNLHLPPVPSQNPISTNTAATTSEPEIDDLRQKTEEFVNAFVDRVLEGMRRNISINGNDVVPFVRESSTSLDGQDGDNMGDAVGVIEVEEFEPYDEKLRARLADLNVKREGLVGRISKHRRDTAAVAAGRFREEWEREMAGVDFGVAGEPMVVDESEVLSVEGLKRGDEVRRNWERAVEGLARLDKGLPETRARLERCGDVVGYLGGGEKVAR